MALNEICLCVCFGTLGDKLHRDRNMLVAQIEKVDRTRLFADQA